MTDREKLVSLLEDFGLGYTEDGKGITEVTLTAKRDEGVEGYTDFFTVWAFGPSGEFLRMGIWE